MEWFAAPAAHAPAWLPPGFTAAQLVVTYRVGSAFYATAPGDDPANMPWHPRILGDVEVSQAGIDALGIGGRLALGIADIDLWDADGALAQMVRYGTADGRPATLRLADVVAPFAADFGTPLGSTLVAFKGVVQRIEHAPNQHAKVTITDAAERLAVPLQPARYAGTGGLEGRATLAGRPKPVLLGERFNVPPVFLGNVDLGDGALSTYAVHWRAVEAIDAVRIRGVLQDEAVGTAPLVGEFRAWPAAGVFQIGSDPDGDVTCDARGDAVGGYVASTAGVVRRLVQSLGPQLTDDLLHVPTFDFAETDLPGAIGYWRGPDETTAAAALDEIIAGSGAIFCGGRDGGVRLVDPLAEGDAQFGLSVGHILAIEPVALPAAIRPLPRTVGVDWRPNAAVLTNLAGSVGADDRAALAAASGGPARAYSATIAQRVGQDREMRLRGLYRDEADALARAERWRAFLEAGPRLFRVTTDRYLGQMEVGTLGAIAYPAFGLDDGAGVVVLGYSEALAGRRLVLTVCTVPWVTVPPLVVTGTGLDFFLLDEDELS
jgi:hypothetical protein